MYRELKLDPKLFKVIVAFDAGATKEYQTSPPGVPAQVLLTAGLELVEPDRVPVTLVQLVPAVNVVAFAQLSLAGVCCSVSVKPYLLELPVGAVVTYTLMK